MNTRSAGATALQFLLLLASLLNAAGCELFCLDEPGSLGTAAQAVGSEAKVGTVETKQDDDCPCCGMCVPRVSFEPSTTIDPTLVLAEVTPIRRGVLFIETLPGTHLSRGPPTG